MTTTTNNVDMQGALQSLRWNGQELDLLDQRLLPEEIVYLPLETPIEVWEAIRHLKVRGAPAIGIAAAYGVYLGIRGVDAAVEGLLAEVQKQADYLATSRPTAVNLFWALDRMRARAEALAAEGVSPDAFKAALLRSASGFRRRTKTPTAVSANMRSRCSRMGLAC